MRFDVETKWMSRSLRVPQRFGLHAFLVFWQLLKLGFCSEVFEGVNQFNKFVATSFSRLRTDFVDLWGSRVLKFQRYLIAWFQNIFSL